MSVLLRLIDNLIAAVPQRAWWIFAFASACFLIWMGLRPASDLPKVSSLPPHTDKLIHFVGYAGLAVCVFRAKYPLLANRPPSGNFPWLAVILVPSLVGLLDEFLQGYTARGRSADPMDWLADTVAGVVVCVAGVVWRNKVKAKY